MTGLVTIEVHHHHDVVGLDRSDWKDRIEKIALERSTWNDGVETLERERWSCKDRIYGPNNDGRKMGIEFVMKWFCRRWGRLDWIIGVWLSLLHTAP